MTETVKVASTEVTQRRLEEIFAALREHHWLGIPQGYQPQLRRFRATDGPVASYEQTVYDLMADNALPDWFKEAFVWAKPDISVKTLF